MNLEPNGVLGEPEFVKIFATNSPKFKVHIKKPIHISPPPMLIRTIPHAPTLLNSIISHSDPNELYYITQ